MGQNFFPDTVNQTLLFPPSLHDWLPDGHLARFWSISLPRLICARSYASYHEKDGRGQAAYAPEMMVRLLSYGYANGVFSLCENDGKSIRTFSALKLVFRNKGKETCRFIQ
jgi:hypothetical protein